jgi:hypothetical protein
MSSIVRTWQRLGDMVIIGQMDEVIFVNTPRWDYIVQTLGTYTTVMEMSGSGVLTIGQKIIIRIAL